MASRGRPWAVFLGSTLAFGAQCLLAATGGQFLKLLPPRTLSIGAGLLFLVFSLWTWFQHSETPQWESDRASEVRGFWTVLGRSFLAIFLAEWGDATQLATASLAAQSTSFWTVVIASMLALCSVAALAVLAGAYLKATLPVRKLKQVASLLFGIFGAYFLWRAVFGVF